MEHDTRPGLSLVDALVLDARHRGTFGMHRHPLVVEARRMIAERADGLTDAPQPPAAAVADSGGPDRR